MPWPEATHILSNREHKYLLEHGNTFQMAPGTAYKATQGEWGSVHHAGCTSVLGSDSSHNQAVPFAGESHLS